MKKQRRISALLLSSCLLLSFGTLCLNGCAKKDRNVRYDVTYGVLFDTVCSFYMGADDKADFDAIQRDLLQLLSDLDSLFSVYKDGFDNNLKTVNDRAGVEPVAVDERILSLMEFSLECFSMTDRTFNPMMGAVTVLWKEAAQTLVLPDEEELRKAGAHIDPSCLVIDKEKSTLYISDPEAKIDVGAIAKGYAARLATEFLEERGVENYLLALGGSISASGTDPKTGKAWKVGVADPTGQENSVADFYLSGLSAVTCGSYERFFEYEGQIYHHIIDPKTLRPARTSSLHENEQTVSVSVFCSDPALADAFSTAFFILPKEKGKELAQKSGMEALWIDSGGNFFQTDGLDLLRARKNTSGEDRSEPAVILFLLFLVVLASVLLFKRVRKENPPAANPEEDLVKTPENSDLTRFRGQNFREEEESFERTSENKKERRSALKLRRKDGIFLGALALVCLVSVLVPVFRKDAGKSDLYAVIRVDGQKLCALPLDGEHTYEVQSSLGKNLVRVKDGYVWIEEADCQGKDCVRRGKINQNSLPAVIACLPHKLTVTFETQPQEHENNRCSEKGDFISP